ncbi:placenta associated 8, tandem duplicate 1 [Acipenser oxyrinchus oxyrinchus]|uniref:Placenta associated 8, tandem duplicate 1 n=1 Tax=Acipenser oxyrinchus oxyrinchus TaxID=40147 RepID=A0AAD8LU07_ACIOX|nr:placenta associated 8, tandem duplicate 1 [Acipenser oxyrinchus oxyrinchus]
MAAVTSQPRNGAGYPTSEFQTGVLDCCDDCGTCCCGLLCFPCLCCNVARDMDECCLFGPSMAMRSLYRARYNIKGSLGILIKERSRGFFNFPEVKGHCIQPGTSRMKWS